MNSCLKADVICPEERGAKRIRNLLSRWHAHLAVGVIPVKVNRQNEFPAVAACKHGSPVTRPCKSYLVSMVKNTPILPVRLMAGEDDTVLRRLSTGTARQ